MKSSLARNKWKPILELEKNHAGRDFVCGDIHGCYADLELNLKENRFDPAKDRMFCVGDLFDRGPMSNQALKYLKEKWFYPVQGNHEYMFLDCASGFNPNGYGSYKNGSEWQWRESNEFLSELAGAVERLPLIIRAGNVAVLHARLPDVDSFEEIEKDIDIHLTTILWSRSRQPPVIKIPGITRVFCGHSVVSEVRAYNGVINIDTGAFLRYQQHHGKLTVVEID